MDEICASLAIALSCLVKLEDAPQNFDVLDAVDEACSMSHMHAVLCNELPC